jgi:transketolase
MPSHTSDVLSLSTLNPQIKQSLQKIATSIRVLSMDAVQKADSGHPGMPLGCAELGAYLYGFLLRHNPKNPKWINRDRLILSAGHGSMWLYSCLHLAGFPLDLEEIKRFRQLNSLTPGHPESVLTPGVESTTGPLGQGIGNAVGTALGLKILGAKLNTREFSLISSRVFVLAGDGCLMEGISHEACSLAGHLGLDNLVLLYDANDISLDGALSDSSSEDTKGRFRALNWDVYEMNGNDLEEIHETIQSALQHQKKPVLIIAKTHIGKGAPTKSGSHKVHGAPLGEEEISKAKFDMGVPEESFYVPQSVREFFYEKVEKDKEGEKEWHRAFEGWSHRHPEKKVEFDAYFSTELPSDLKEEISTLSLQSPTSGRQASSEVIQWLAAKLPKLYGGSADLSCSDLTLIKNGGIISKDHFQGRNIKFGVREFAMGAMATGLAQTGAIFPFVGTFLTFSDYMRNAIRLAALMKEKVIYQFTHDSILLGEDGPTHQPVEQLASLRAIPHLQVIRPSGVYEVKMAWYAALIYKGPTALILSRQKVNEVPGTNVPYEEGMAKGAYVVRKEKSSSVDYTLVATGSELPLAMDVASELERLGRSVRVVSMPSWAAFEKQNEEYKKSIFGNSAGKKVSIEAASDMGWHKYIGSEGIAIAVDDFGISAPVSDIVKEFGFTVDDIIERILRN